MVTIATYRDVEPSTPGYYRQFCLSQRKTQILFLFTAPCSSDGMSKQGPDKRPFTCKGDPSNNVSVEEEQPADDKEDMEVSRLWSFYSALKRLDKGRKWEVNSPVAQRAQMDKKYYLVSNSPGLYFIGGDSGEADLHGLSETRTTNPKGSVVFIIGLFSAI